MPPFMPIACVTGPFTTMTGPAGIVVASTPCTLNASVQAASTAASTTGRCSGRQPASTALTATFSTVQGTRSGGTIATTSSGARVVPASIASTRSSVGGTTGSPSVQPRAYAASTSSSRSASSTVRLVRTRSPYRRSRSASTPHSTDREPQPGRWSGRSGPRPGTPVSSSQELRSQPTVRAASVPSSTRSSVGTVSTCSRQLVSSSWSSMTASPAGKPGSSWL